jgi:hypothetical protein
MVDGKLSCISEVGPNAGCTRFQTEEANRPARMRRQVVIPEVLRHKKKG